MKKNKLIDIGIISMIILGILIMSYPFISQYFYRNKASKQVDQFKQTAQQIGDAEVDRKIRLADIFNQSLTGIYTSDPFTSQEKKEAIDEYARMLEVNELIGSVSIPKIGEDLPVYAGTSEEVLQKGVGHLEGTSLPVGGENTHAVITAHRGLPTAKLFTDLDQLEVGDSFYFTNLKETLYYEVVDINVIEPSDFSKLRLEKGKDYMTLLTCTPYMVNSHRLLVKGERRPYKQLDVNQIEVKESNNYYKKLFYAAMAMLVLLMIYIIYSVRKYRKLRKEMSEIKNN